MRLGSCGLPRTPEINLGTDRCQCIRQVATSQVKCHVVAQYPGGNYHKSFARVCPRPKCTLGWKPIRGPVTLDYKKMTTLQLDRRRVDGKWGLLNRAITIPTNCTIYLDSIELLCFRWANPIRKPLLGYQLQLVAWLLNITSLFYCNAGSVLAPSVHHLNCEAVPLAPSNNLIFN